MKCDLNDIIVHHAAQNFLLVCFISFFAKHSLFPKLKMGKKKKKEKK